VDLGAIGYFPADAIARSAVENNFKVIALKGLLEHQIGNPAQLQLSDTAIRVMNLMDALLKRSGEWGVVKNSPYSLLPTPYSLLPLMTDSAHQRTDSCC